MTVWLYLMARLKLQPWVWFTSTLSMFLATNSVSPFLQASRNKSSNVIIFSFGEDALELLPEGVSWGKDVVMLIFGDIAGDGMELVNEDITMEDNGAELIIEGNVTDASWEADNIELIMEDISLEDGAIELIVGDISLEKLITGDISLEEVVTELFNGQLYSEEEFPEVINEAISLEEGGKELISEAGSSESKDISLEEDTLELITDGDDVKGQDTRPMLLPPRLILHCRSDRCSGWDHPECCSSFERS